MTSRRDFVRIAAGAAAGTALGLTPEPSQASLIGPIRVVVAPRQLDVALLIEQSLKRSFLRAEEAWLMYGEGCRSGAIAVRDFADAVVSAEITLPHGLTHELEQT